MTLDDLSGYPCPYVELDDPGCQDECANEPAEPCEFVAIYRAHIALRKAVLGEIGEEFMVSAWHHRLSRKEYMATMYRRQADMYNPISPLRDHFEALADVVEGMNT